MNRYGYASFLYSCVVPEPYETSARNIRVSDLLEALAGFEREALDVGPELLGCGNWPELSARCRVIRDAVLKWIRTSGDYVHPSFDMIPERSRRFIGVVVSRHSPTLIESLMDSDASRLSALAEAGEHLLLIEEHDATVDAMVHEVHRHAAGLHDALEQTPQRVETELALFVLAVRRLTQSCHMEDNRRTLSVLLETCKQLGI